MDTTHTNSDLSQFVESLSEPDIRRRIADITAKYEAEVQPLKVLLRAAVAKRREQAKAAYLKQQEEGRQR